jgi:hypothetical protein
MEQYKQIHNWIVKNNTSKKSLKIPNGKSKVVNQKKGRQYNDKKGKQIPIM